MYRTFVSRLRYYWNRFLSVILPIRYRFARIYNNRHWGGQLSESASGRGSSLAATKRVRAELPSLLHRLECETLLDIGCGDFNWMRHVNLDCSYIGIDVVRALIEKNQANFGGPDINFYCIDAVSEPLPAHADVVLCREVLFHLSFRHALQLISNVKRTNARYFIATHIPDRRANSDTFTGGFRPLDLSKAPFHFPEPAFCIPDDGISENRLLCLWRLDDNQTVDP